MVCRGDTYTLNISVSSKTKEKALPLLNFFLFHFQTTHAVRRTLPFMQILFMSARTSTRNVQLQLLQTPSYISHTIKIPPLKSSLSSNQIL